MPVPTLTANSPANGSIAWAAFTIQYGGKAFPIAAGNTANRFVWWLYNGGSGGPLQMGDTLPDGSNGTTALGPDDLLLFINKNGTPVNAQSASIVDGSIIATESIVGDSIAANTITGAKILAGTVSAREIAGNSITADQIATGAITADELAANAVTAAKILANTITAAQIAADTITAAQIATDAVTANEIAANTITSAEIQAGGITADWFSATTIVADLLGATKILTQHIDAQQITTSLLAAGAVTAQQIAANTITAAQIAAGTVTANEIAANTITAAQIAAGTVTANEIAADYEYAGTITADQINAGTLTDNITLSALIQTSDSGQRVVMDPQGLHLYDPNGKPIIELPTNPGDAASFTGSADMSTLGVAAGLSVKNPPKNSDGTQPLAGTIEAGASVELANGVQPPGTTPTVSQSIPNVQITNLSVAGNSSNFATWYLHGCYVDGANGYLVCSDNNNVHRVQRFPIGGGGQNLIVSPTFTSTQMPAPATATKPAILGTCKIGTTWYLLYFANATAANNGTYRVTAYTDDGFGTQVAGHADAVVQATSEQVVGITTDGTYLYLACIVTARDGSSGLFRVRQIDPSTMNTTSGGVYTAASGSPVLTNNASGWLTDVVGGLAYGNFDMGAGPVSRFVVYDHQTRTFYSYSLSGTTLTEQPNERWSDFAQGGWCYDGTNFRQASSEATKGTNCYLYKFSNLTWLTDSSTWWAGYTWRNVTSGQTTRESAVSPRTSFAMTKRRYLTISGSTIPTFGSSADPNTEGMYLGRGSADPLSAGMHYVADGTTVTIGDSGFPFTSAAPQASTQGFPTTAASDLHSGARRADGTPKNRVGGDGTANLDGLVPPGSVQMFAGATAPAGWLLCDGKTYNNSTYPDLSAVLGTTYGGSTSNSTFGVPDMRSRVPMGPGTFAVGANEGETDEPTRNKRWDHSHNHGTGTLAAASAGAHTHTIGGGNLAGDNTAQGGGGIGRLFNNPANQTHDHGGATGSNGAHTHTNTGSTGTNSGLNNNAAAWHPYIVLAYIIKT